MREELAPVINNAVKARTFVFRIFRVGRFFSSLGGGIDIKNISTMVFIDKFVLFEAYATWKNGSCLSAFYI